MSFIPLVLSDTKKIDQINYAPKFMKQIVPILFSCPKLGIKIEKILCKTIGRNHFASSVIAFHIVIILANISVSVKI